MPSKAELRAQWNNAGDKVILHQFPRAKPLPSPSPYPLKFETYLRIAEIPYEAEFTQPMSSKGKTPWMTFRGKDMADSQLCMDHLAETLNKDLSAHLSAEEKAISRGLRAILEDNLYFCAVMDRWVFGDINHIRNNVFGQRIKPNFLEGFIMGQVSKRLKKQAEGQGIGRHSKKEIYTLAKKNLKALSDYLGTKEYLFGDKPVDTDCVLFAFVAQNLFAAEKGSEMLTYLENTCPNLKEHALRIKEKYWPDWEQCLHGYQSDGSNKK